MLVPLGSAAVRAESDPLVRTRVRGRAEALRLCLVEARPVVTVMFLVRFLVAVVLAEPATNRYDAVAVAGIAVVLATIAVYLGNGVLDVVEDHANGCMRPLATGRLDRGVAAAMTLASAVAAVVSAALAGPAVLAAMIAFLALGYAYSAPPSPLKTSAIGTAATGIGGTLLVYVAGWTAAGGGFEAGGAAFAMLMAMWTGIAGSTKDLSDARGDALAGRRTLPVLLGPERARTALAVGVAAVAMSAVMATVVIDLGLFPAAVSLLVGGAVMVRFLRGDSTGSATYRVFMATQFVAHAAAVVP